MMWRRFRTNFRYGPYRYYVYIGVLVIAIVSFHNYMRLRTVYTGTKYDLYKSVFGESILPEPTQKEIDYFAKNVHIKFTVDDNFASGDRMGGGGFYIATVSLINAGNDVLTKTKWQLYGYFARLAEPFDHPYPMGFYLNSCGLKLFHIDGSLYKFEPTESGFTELRPNQQLSCKIKLLAFQVAKTDSFPRWYVTSGATVPQIVENTDDESLSFVSDFKYERQFKRRSDDTSYPYTAQQRYKIYSDGRREINMRLKVIPTPLEMDVNEDMELEFNSDSWVLVKSDAFSQEIQQFSDEMEMKIVKSKPMRKYLQISKADVTVTVDGVSVQNEEAYTLEANAEKDHIVITAGTNRGAFYALQTLRSVLFAPEAGTSGNTHVMIPGFTITDAPRYSYRGLHLDVARNFIDAKEVKKVLDLMAMYKMNKLHLHLSDDEGWRLEIPGVPELTQIGASRCHDPVEHQCIFPGLGSGPYSNTSGSGYYSIADYRDILQYANEKFIQIIPEIDMPGHSRAAIKSIHAESQRSIRNKMKAQVYSIIDETRPSAFVSPQYFSNNVINPCMNSSYEFVQKIMTALKNMHQDIQPLSLYHFGGDEVADGAWADSEVCMNLMSMNKDITNQYDLMKYFVKNLTKIASDEGISVGAWEDGMLSHDKTKIGIPFPRDTFSNKDIYVYIWKRPSEKRTPHRARLFANKGYKVVLAYGSYLYFDHPYEPDPEERGLYWATRKISTKDVWSFTQNVIFKDSHLECPSQIQDKSQCSKLLIPENVVGMQAELWTETIRANEHVEYMLLPRLLALAERAWHKASWENAPAEHVTKRQENDWSKFVNAVGYHELPRLDRYGYQYRIPPPGAQVKGGKVFFNTEFPGLEIEYYAPETKSWRIASRDMAAEKPFKIRTRSADGLRYSREVLFDPGLTSAAFSLTVCSLMVVVFIVICRLFATVL